MSLLEEPRRARQAYDAAQAHLAKDGTTGRAKPGGAPADLRIPVSDVGEAALPIREQLDAALLGQLLSDPNDEPWRAGEGSDLDLTLKREASVLRLSGAARFGLRHTCGRCLEDVEFELPLALDLTLIVGMEKGALSSETELAHAMPDGEESEVLDDTDLVHFDGRTVALDEILREQIFLELPMHPACGGAYARDQEMCALDKDGVLAAEKARWKDPRWAALEDLRDSLPED